MNSCAPGKVTRRSQLSVYIRFMLFVRSSCTSFLLSFQWPKIRDRRIITVKLRFRKIVSEKKTSYGYCFHVVSSPNGAHAVCCIHAVSSLFLAVSFRPSGAYGLHMLSIASCCPSLLPAVMRHPPLSRLSLRCYQAYHGVCCSFAVLPWCTCMYIAVLSSPMLSVAV